MSADITPDELATIRQSVEAAGPDWYYYTQTMRLIAAVESARSQLAALQSVPQGVEVPEFTIGDLTKCDMWEGEQLDYYETARNINAWFRARLVPTPPQANAVMVPREEWEAFRTLEGKMRLPSAYLNLREQACLDALDALRTSAQDHNGEGAK